MPDEKWGVSRLSSRIYWAWWLRERMQEAVRDYLLSRAEAAREVEESCDTPVVVEAAESQKRF